MSSNLATINFSKANFINAVNLYLTDKLNSGIKKNSIKTYRSALGIFANFVDDYNAPTLETVRSFMDSLKAQNRTPKTQLNYLTTLRGFFKWTARLAKFPDITLGYKNPRLNHNFKKQPLTVDESRRLLDSAKGKSLIQIRDKAILTLMVTAGLRCIEVARLKVSDINVRGDIVILDVQGKGYDEKMPVKISKGCYQVIDRYLSARGNVNSSQPLFSSLSHRNTGKSLTADMISRICKKHLKLIGINSKDVTAHSLRHTAATLAIKAGASIDEVQKQLRHVNINTTMIYIENINVENNSASDRVSKLVIH